MANVTLNSITKTYAGGTQALFPSSFEIADGELVVLVGPSGCGKSTMLRMVAGLEEITDGTIAIDGTVVNDLDPAERDIAMVFQNYALYPHMTVYGNMAYGLKNRGTAKDEIDRKVREAAEILNLTEYLERRPSQLSGGQRQRVAMGRAIVREPKLFLFDEPLSNLDAKLRNQMRVEIRSLQRRMGVTSIYVTHDQVEAMTMADRIVVMNAGRIEQIGTPEEIYHRPASTFVASFMGAPPMNLLPGRYDGNGTADLAGMPVPVGAHGVAGAVQIGVRPEDVALGQGTLPFDVTLIEDLGAHRLLHGELGGHSFIASAPNAVPVQEGRTMIQLPKEAVVLFNADTGQRV